MICKKGHGAVCKKLKTERIKIKCTTDRNGTGLDHEIDRACDRTFLTTSFDSNDSASAKQLSSIEVQS